MHFFIAADKFKDALSAEGVVAAIERGLRKACPEAVIDAIPLADGGEGSLEVWLNLEGGRRVEVEAMDPLNRPVKAGYGLSADGKTAFVEMAQASGLERLLPEERNCWETSSLGTGQLIGHALDQGVERVILAVGGSATVDGGTGMAEGLGFLFFDEKGKLVLPKGGHLSRIQKIDTGKVHPRLADVDIEVWTDVDNPLRGPHGAAYTFARQKGASENQIPLLDEGLKHLEQLCQIPGDTPGAGAAGGLAYGALAFLDARLFSGITRFLSFPALDQAFSQADWVITGEGRLDAQTRHGKLIHGICEKARQHDLPVIALCGSVALSREEIKEMGLHAAFSINKNYDSLAEALSRTSKDLELTARNLGL